MGSEVQVRVLMVTFSTHGHLNPTLRLAKRLVSKGLHVTVATTEAARKHLMLNPTATQITESTRDSDDFDRIKYVGAFIESLQKVGSKNLSSIINNLSNNDKKKSCIITNPFMPWVPDVAAEHKIPCAVLWIQACAAYYIYYHYFKHPQLFPSLENPNEAVHLPAMPSLLVNELPSFLLPSGPIHFKQMVSDFVQKLDKVKWILGSSFYELEENVVASMATFTPIIPVGPLVSPFMLGKQENATAPSLDMWSTAEEYSCIEIHQWLNKKPPSSVIYISFGSLLVLSQNQIDSIAAALINTKRPFLWVIRSQENKEGGVLPAGFLEVTKDRGLVVKWCSQEKVLMHPAVSCFLTHCGRNSTLETVAAGISQTDAKLLVHVFKIGVRMRNEEDGTLSIQQVQRCTDEATQGLNATQMKKRAVALKEAAKKALEDGGSSDANIDRFINEITGK
ncbi:UDP-glycosyltransferase 84B1 [Citrus sinensis]|uniref:UDP-glycosyltransferase 84B1 n=1 Tax=Citrus sinensis TaxID=2711 RepID=A0ACB8J3V9_CITSI|nr:UDP-glycosyltransferase 84B1 [Citrus sinensis]